MLRRVRLIVLGIAVMLMASSCSTISGWFHHDDKTKPTSVSVFDLKVGDCFVAPKDVKAELSDLSQVPCDVDHQQELYAKVDYQDGSGKEDTATNVDAPYPGNAALKTFAKGACAERYEGYVGIAYPDSGLWSTFLLPSARSWKKDDDRSVLCFVTTTGKSLTQSVKGSKM